MPEDKVAIVKKDGTFVYYNTYAAARAASNPNSGDHDLIQIRAILNERIILKDGVDIWILPGIVVDYNPSSATSQLATISDGSAPCKCNIFGEGVIVNTYNNVSDTNKFHCIVTSNANTELSVECDYIQGIGGPGDLGAGASVHIIKAKKFELTCNRVYSQNSAAVFLGNTVTGEFVNDANINIKNVEVGTEADSDPNIPQAFGIMSFGNGFVNIDEIKCHHHGHCILHRNGEITASVKKLTVINNKPKADATVIVGHGSTTQKLILYYDEIQALQNGVSVTSGPGFDLYEGTGILIGRRVFSKDGPAIQILGANTKGFLKCNEIDTGTEGSLPVVAMSLSNFTNELTIDSNYIKGYRNFGVIFTNDANVVIKNAKIKNTYVGSDVGAVGVYVSGTQRTPTLNNLKITIDLVNMNNNSIYYPQGGNIKNYGLFVNKDLPTNVILLVGPKTNDPNHVYNYQYIADPGL